MTIVHTTEVEREREREREEGRERSGIINITTTSFISNSPSHRPHLLQVILYRCTSEDQPVINGDLYQCTIQEGLWVLQSVSLVNY